MSQKHMEEWMNPYIDGVLSEEERRIYEAHLKECPQCRKEVEELRAFIGLLNDMEEEELPESFHQNLHQKLVREQQAASEENRKPRSMGWVKWAGAAAAAAVVLLASIQLLGGMDSFLMERSDGALPEQEMNMAADQLDSGQEDTQMRMAAAGEPEMIKKGPDQEMPRAVQDEADTAGQESDQAPSLTATVLGTEDKIRSSQVEVRVKDICVTVETLENIALQNNMELSRTLEDGVIIRFTDESQRETLYRELSLLGEVVETGQQTDTEEVTVTLVQEESE